MEYWYFTFGCGTKYGNRRNKYVKIPGDYETARKRMVDYYGKKWCTQYDEEHFKESIKSMDTRNTTRESDLTRKTNGNLDKT